MAMPNYFSLARPDETDADVYAHLAEKRWGKPTPTLDSPLLVGRCQISTLQVSVSPNLIPAEVNDPRLAVVRNYLYTWTEARAGIGGLVTLFWPLEPLTPPSPGARGSTSGHDILKDGHRAAYVTIYDTYGCAEGIWHEFAHLRLRTLGVNLEDHDGTLLLNESSERYVSPIRRDILRPMSAVLHGVYAWVMLTEGDLRLACAGHLNAVLGTMLWNLPKIEEGLITLKEQAQWTRDGQEFFNALYIWGSELVMRSWSLLGWDRRPAALISNYRWVKDQPVNASVLHDREHTEELCQ